MGEWSQKYGGPIRRESALLIRDLISSLHRRETGRDILILTPFRAQRVLIRSLLNKSGLSSVTVSTVHRAQGTEREVVIFDPVNGESRFLQKPKAANLINVALSRAKRRLIIVLSPADRRNVLLDRIARAVEENKEPIRGTDPPLAVHLL
jgi:superfamily I DNA and/or RNA helicase